MPRDRAPAATKQWPLIVGGAFVLATLSPLALNQPDSFPLSTYPMFAKPRGNPELVKLVAVTSTGEQISVPPHLLGTNEVLQAKSQLNQIAHKGNKAKRRYCEGVAARVRQEPNLHWQELQLQRAHFNPIEYFENAGKPLDLEVLTSCVIRPLAPPSNADVSADD